MKHLKPQFLKGTCFFKRAVFLTLLNSNLEAWTLNQKGAQRCPRYIYKYMFIYTYLQLFECTIICIYLFVQSVFDKYIVLYSVTKDAQDPVNFPHASSGSCMSTPVLIQKLPTGSAYQGTSNRKEWNHWRTNANFEPPSDNHDNQFKLHFTCATLKLWFWHNQSHTIHVYPCMVYLPT